MKNFILIFLSTLAGYTVGELLHSKFFVIGVILFSVFFISLNIDFSKDKYTYWLITVQKPSKTGSQIIATSSLKIENKFITSKIINAYYNELYSETGKWNILFYSKLTKEEFNLYNSNENQNE